MQKKKGKKAKEPTPSDSGDESTSSSSSSEDEDVAKRSPAPSKLATHVGRCVLFCALAGLRCPWFWQVCAVPGCGKASAGGHARIKRHAVHRALATGTAASKPLGSYQRCINAAVSAACP